MKKQKPFARGHGILMPLFSLNSKYGIGVMGKPAKKFIDFLSRTGADMWQLLPLGPTGYGNSPYQCFSAFAGNSYFLNPEWFLKKGWIDSALLKKFEEPNKGKVNYANLYKTRNNLYSEIFSQFKKFASENQKKDFKKFYNKNKYWLYDYSVFSAIKEYFGNCGRLDFPKYKIKSDDAIQFAENNLKDRMNFFAFLEYAFNEQWQEIRRYAKKKNILLVGDIPIYVSDDSADVWANPHLFSLSSDGTPTAVAGVPPDIFSKNGQLWGNPLYDWDAHISEKFSWWKNRITRQAELFDVIRIDHFIGFCNYYSIPYNSKTAINGKWLKGPGKLLTSAITEAASDTKFIAEDLGPSTPSVKRLIKSTSFPGMKLLQFAFDGTDNPNMLHNIPKNSVVYTGTHDNQTTVGFFSTCDAEVRKTAEKYTDVAEDQSLTMAIIKECHKSRANTAIIPLYDYLKLDDLARINTPATTDNNWVWRIKQDPTDHLAKEIYAIADIYKRVKTRKD